MNLQLEQLLTYQNEHVCARYEHDFPLATLSASEALAELMKFIWLFHKHLSDKSSQPGNDRLNFSCVIHKEMIEIDNMWHTFLLFTKAYHQFCDEYLHGRFFHHVPILKSEQPFSKESYTDELEKYLSYIYDKLGEDTLLKWFPIAK